MRKINALLILMLLPILYGCRLKRPESVLSPKKMEQFLYDYHLAQAIGQDLPQNEKYTTGAYIDWAYRRNNITKEEFERSLIWYTRYPKELNKIYKRLSNRIDDEYKAVSKSLSQIEKKSFSIQSGDSVDLWYLDRTALLNTSAYMNNLTYHINRDTGLKNDPGCLRIMVDIGFCIFGNIACAQRSTHDDDLSDHSLEIGIFKERKSQVRFRSDSYQYQFAIALSGLFIYHVAGR